MLTHSETYSYPSYLDPEVKIAVTKSKTTRGVDIVHLDDEFDLLYNDLPNNTNSFNIIDFQAVSEFDIVSHAKFAVSVLPKKDNVVVGYTTEALNSTYWNVVFDILQEAGYKNILWIDGGLTIGKLFRHLHKLNIRHFTAPTFFRSLYRPTVVEQMPQPGDISNRTLHYLSLGRLVRRERIYFTKKLLDDPVLFKKGIVTCGWGDSTLSTWQSEYDKNTLRLMLTDEDISKFPVTLGHNDSTQHYFIDTFKSAIFNVVQESSIGDDPRSHNAIYDPFPAGWNIVSSDRIFFTEKTAKAFLMNQIPLLIAAPGMVQTLRDLEFDMFDDIVDHSYDREDNILKRCDMVYNELNRLVSSHTVEGWVKILQSRNISKRFFKNHENVRRLTSSDHIATWVKENF